MTDIILICAAGISTGTIVKEMKNTIEEDEVKVNVSSVGIADANHAIKDADIVLLGPQIGYLKSAMEDLLEVKKPVAVIDKDVYASMDGKKVLDFALNLK